MEIDSKPLKKEVHAYTSENLKRRTIQGGFVAIGSRGATFLLRTGSMVVMARLLMPEEFGLVGMVTAVTGVLGLFKDAGLSAVTVQRATISDEQVSTLFWINLAVGVGLAVISLGVAPILVAFYGEPRLYWVTVVLSTGFVVNGASQQHQALLQRQMRFVAMSVIDILTWLVGIAVGITMALSGFGYWALVGMTVSIPVVCAVCVWIVTSWIPGMPRKRVGTGSMLRFGGTVTLNGLILYLAYNVDKVLLGRIWGAASLGVYGRAYQLINLPTEQLNSAIGSVAVPALSRLQEDPKRLRTFFLKGYALVLALTVPMTIACGLLADDMIYVLLGSKWMGAAAIFRLLAPTVFTLALLNPLGWLLWSTGMVRRSLNIALVMAPVIIAGFIAGLRFGPNGVALGYSIAMMLLVVPIIGWAIQGSVISRLDVLQAVKRPCLSGIVAGIITFVLQLVLRETLPPVPRLLLEGVVLLGSYLWILLYVMGQKDMYLDLFRELRSRPTDGKEVPPSTFSTSTPD